MPFFHPARSGRLAAAVAVLTVCVWAVPATALDANGRYTVKGAGLASCEKFLEIAKEGGREF